MKTYMAVFLGSADAPGAADWSRLNAAARRSREAEGMAAWGRWIEKYADAIVENGPPLGKTKRVDASGIADVTNALTAYAIVRAETHEEAASLFLDHPHFTVFPGTGIEVMECLPMPEM